MSELDVFLQECATEIERRAELASSQPVLNEGAAAFRCAVAASGTVEAEITTVPVARHLPGLLDAAPEIPWVATPRLEDGGEHVALGLVNPVRDLGDVQCGLILVAPGAAYPEHRHAPQELYLPLSGRGDWMFGGSDSYRSLGVDELVYNHPRDLHGVRANDEVLLALYVLWP